MKLTVHFSDPDFLRKAGLFDQDAELEMVFIGGTIDEAENRAVLEVEVKVHRNGETGCDLPSDPFYPPDPLSC